jgi:hypothetical protein
MSRWLDLARKADDEFSNSKPRCENLENCESRGGMSQLSQLSQFSPGGAVFEINFDHAPAEGPAEHKNPGEHKIPAQGVIGPDMTPAPASGLDDQWAAVAAHLGALVGCQTPEDAADAKVRYWREALGAMTLPTDRKLADVIKACRAMAYEPWLRDAAALGWDERDLFGYAGAHAKAGHGLLVGIALAAEGRSLPSVTIAADHAEVVTDKGNRLRVPKQDGSPPIWT